MNWKEQRPLFLEHLRNCRKLKTWRFAKRFCGVFVGFLISRFRRCPPPIHFKKRWYVPVTIELYKTISIVIFLKWIPFIQIFNIYKFNNGFYVAVEHLTIHREKPPYNEDSAFIFWITNNYREIWMHNAQGTNDRDMTRSGIHT